MIPTRPNVIPCKRPKVTVDDLGPGFTLRYVAVCATGTCEWSYLNVVKSDVQEQAKHHRAEHRMAVPAAAVDANWVADEHGVHWQRGYTVKCECGLDTVRGTRSDADAHLDHHLSAVHGLVS